MKFIEYPDRELLYAGLADAIVSELGQALTRPGRASLALPGGTTPAPLFDLLSGVALDWQRIDVLLTDERWVPEDNPRSNTALLRARLLRDRAAQASLVPLYAGTGLPEESLGALEGAVRGLMPLDVVLLGMGEDAHVASLFPGADKLDLALSPNAPALVAMRADTVPEPRVTLSAPVLNSAMAKFLLITGSRKREVLERARGKLPEAAPVAAVLDGLAVHWAP